MRSTQFPSCIMASAGARRVVVSLTEGMMEPLCLSAKERSRMVRNRRDLCGTMATGLIFNFFGGLCLMSFHLTTFA